MAVFIKKERLGSAPPRPDTFKLHRDNFKGATKFGVMKQAMEQAKAQADQSRKETYESNAEVQRWRGQMTEEERGRDAIERMVPNSKQYLELKNGGQEVSYEDARKHAESLCERTDKLAEDKKK